MGLPENSLAGRERFDILLKKGGITVNLCDEKNIRALLGRHGFHFSKSMGQNFLIDPAVPSAIAEASGADESNLAISSTGNNSITDLQSAALN